MHYKKVKGILSKNNGMNIYRGCTNGCIYCDARSKCYNMQHEFTDIEIKENALELLEQKLKSKRKKCMISTGAMTDPYLHLEKTIQYTKKSLEIIEKYGFGLAIQTKSSSILRDLELLKKINTKSKCVVQMTLTTFDENLVKILEPNVSTTKERFETLMTLKNNGIKTVVWIDPILPFINDTTENLKGILDYCVKAEVYGIISFGIGLTLREGNREYFYEQLDKNFPGLKEKYIKTYGNSYELKSLNHINLKKLLIETCEKHNIEYRPNKIFNYLNEFVEKEEQLSLF